MKTKPKLSIIIKALNEENNIARSIKSALKAIKKIEGEVILADSLSTDNTIQIAKRYPIKIVQLSNPKNRSCGVGPQIGYLHSKGNYIYILDGDMELNTKFITLAIKELDGDKRLAGVAGRITEMTTDNIVFRRRKKVEGHKVEKSKYEGKLMMGGLYKRQAIEKAGYFSNPYLHAYEESDLGNKLVLAGFRLKRIPFEMIKHYGDKGTSCKIILNRWKSRYMWGCGEYLRYNLGKPTILKVIDELKMYITVIIWWLILIASIFLYRFIPEILELQLLITVLFISLFLIKKRSIAEVMFSIFSWNVTALGLIFGFIQKPKKIPGRIRVNTLK